MRLIDADKFNKFLIDEYHGMISDESMKIYKILRLIDEQPTVDAEPVRHGKWKVKEVDAIFSIFTCSECGRKVKATNFYFETPTDSVAYYYPYCHCGAKMQGEKDDEQA